MPGIKRCCCFAHLRRYFVEAVPKGKELDYGNPAAQGVQYINRLFEQERYSAAQKHTPEQRYAYRLEKEKPILGAFWTWLSQQTPKKGTRLEKAVNYAQNHKAEFMTYLEDGRCSFSNNLSENAIRPFTVGRKNWQKWYLGMKPFRQPVRVQCRVKCLHLASDNRVKCSHF